MKKTECSRSPIEFTPLNRRAVISSFDGDSITSDAGLLLLREINEKFQVTQQFADCFTHYRDPNFIDHQLQELLSQRVLALYAGYEDLNDHDVLREDTLYSVLVNKADPHKKIAGKGTLNRLEKATFDQTGPESRYFKISASERKIEDLLVHLFIQGHDNPPEEIILDVDATDSILHGHQEERFFPGYYGNYCYLPLYITCNDFVVVAKLRPSDIDASKGTAEELERIVKIIREHWPNVKILVRGDSGFCRDKIMTWCEENSCDFIFGIARNKRLETQITKEKEEVEELYTTQNTLQRVYCEFMHQPLKMNWSQERRVIAKAEHSAKGGNPRFIITSLKGDRQQLYEEIYCQRGDMENRIKEQQLYLFANRMSCSKMKGNQIRLWLSTIAYTLFHLFRINCLKGTDMEKAQCQTNRNRLMKIGGLIKVSVRRIYLSLSEGFCGKDIFAYAMSKMKFLQVLRC